MDCNINAHLERCNCSYEPCLRKGKCCECIAFHLEMDELPACVFPPDIDPRHNRSMQNFANWYLGR